jgi:hypothetical protein
MTESITHKMLERLAASPLGRQLAAEEQAEALAQRRRWIAQRAQLRAEFERRQPELVAAAAAAEIREAALTAELKRAREARSAAALAVTAASLALDVADGALVRSLRTAPHKRELDRHGRVLREWPCDPEALCFLCRSRDLKWRLLARAEEAAAAVQTPPPGVTVNPFTGRASEHWTSNAPENRRVIEAVGAACQQLAALELEVLDDAELTARLAGIEASVPLSTNAVPTNTAPFETPAEERARGWREAEQEAQR